VKYRVRLNDLTSEPMSLAKAKALQGSFAVPWARIEVLKGGKWVFYR
jgi:hypothetical protein